MENQNTQIETSDFRLNWLYKISGTSAVIVGGLFLIAFLDLFMVVLQPRSLLSRLSTLQNNWLIVIFKLHAGFSAIQIERLHILNLLDLAILALVGSTFLGLYAAFKNTSKIWSIIAVAQPFIGILLFIATKEAGRSSVMGAVLVISVIMLRKNNFNGITGYSGVIASVLLLAGDFSAGIIPPSPAIAALFGFGYVLLIAWLFMIARRLFQLGFKDRKAD